MSYPTHFSISTPLANAGKNSPILQSAVHFRVCYGKGEMERRKRPDCKQALALCRNSIFTNVCNFSSGSWSYNGICSNKHLDQPSKQNEQVNALSY